MPDPKKPTTPSPPAPKAPAPSAPKVSASTAASIPFDQFTESTMSAVLRAANAQKLGHVPIVIGIIFHPGLGGYGGGTQSTCGYAATIKPFFTQCYQQHMAFMFDLWNPADVQSHWQAIHDAVSGGSMPAPGCPGTFDKAAFLTAFQCWKDSGFPP
jgi:hypothetical protein